MDASHDRTPEVMDPLRRRLERARRRLLESARGGPEWDAAMAEVEELEARLDGAMGALSEQLTLAG